MYELAFVKGKWLITKDIDLLRLSAWFECSMQLYKILHELVDKILILKVELDWNAIELKCFIGRDLKWNTCISFINDHWLFKLDIMIHDILLSWYIIKWNITLITN